MWRQSGLWIQITNPHRIQIQGPVWRAPLTLSYMYFINRGFHVTSYLANFASHNAQDSHISFLSAQDNIGKEMFHYFLFSSYHITKSQLSDKNISTHTQL